MTNKEKFSAVKDMLNAAYGTIEAAKNFVDGDSTEPCWSVYHTLSCLASMIWSMSRVIENQKTEGE